MCVLRVTAPDEQEIDLVTSLSYLRNVLYSWTEGSNTGGLHAFIDSGAYKLINVKVDRPHFSLKIANDRKYIVNATPLLGSLTFYV